MQPLIEANWGDTVQITVHNKISNPEEGTSLHGHGISHQQEGWEDGVPAVSQCPISPGQSYTYQFRATPHGSSWYHSHYSSQYADGLWGPLVIHGPSSASYDLDLGPVALSDHFYRGYTEIVEDVVGKDLKKVRPASDNNLINGKMDSRCTTDTEACSTNAGISRFNFTSGKRHRLRLVNSGVQSIQHFSIDSHPMTVIAKDWIPTKPYQTNLVTLAVSEH